MSAAVTAVFEPTELLAARVLPADPDSPRPWLAKVSLQGSRGAASRMARGRRQPRGAGIVQPVFAAQGRARAVISWMMVLLASA